MAATEQDSAPDENPEVHEIPDSQEAPLTAESTEQDEAAAAPPVFLDPKSWNEAVGWLVQLSETPRVYRGQRNYAWTLKTRLARDFQRLPANINKLALENSVIGL